MAHSKEECLATTLRCADTIHRGLPSCEDYFFTLFSNAILETTKFYTPLYLFSTLLTTRRFSLSLLFKKVIPAIALSSLAVATHGSTFGYFSCLVTKVTKTQYQSSYIMSSVLCATLSILIERKQRRPELAVYCCNHAVECLFRMLCCRGILHPIKNGEELLFGATFAGLVYYYHHKRKYLPSSMTALFKLLLGDSNNNQTQQQPDIFDRLANQFLAKKKDDSGISRSNNGSGNDNVSALSSEQNHSHTRDGTSCIVNSLVGFVRGFGIGVSVRFILSVLPSLLKIMTSSRSKITRPQSRGKEILQALSTSLVGEKTLKFGAFMSTLAGVSKITSCVVHSSCGFSNDSKNFVGTFGGGLLAVLVARGLGLVSTDLLSHELTMYLLSKVGETLFWDVGVEKFGIPTWEHGDSLLYIVACTILFYNSVYEPQNLRLSYWAFLLRMSNGWFFDAVKGFDGLRSELQTPGNTPNFHRSLLPLLTPQQRQREREIDWFHKPWLASR